MISVFLVEDEIVTREGMRETVDWRGMGCELVGDASDGELALPLISERKPDVIITDIKMPFMDGLELTRLVKAMRPGTRVVILTGHDEFQFAQQAVALGVTEYLLKPVSLQDLERTLHRLSEEIEAERHEQRRLAGLAEQVEHGLAWQRERFLAQIVAGGLASADALEQARRLDVDLAAPGYRAATILAHGACDGPPPADLSFVEALLGRMAHSLDRLIWFRKDVDEFTLLLQGPDADATALQAAALAQEVAATDAEARRLGRCRLTLGVGPACDRLGGVAGSYHAALRLAQAATGQGVSAAPAAGRHIAAMEKAREFIEARLADPQLSLNDVARHVHMSPSHFSVVFKRERGEAFSEYLTRLRIENAKALLSAGRLRVHEIAERVGYSDAHYFSAAFKKATGMTPKEYRSLGV